MRKAIEPAIVGEHQTRAVFSTMYDVVAPAIRPFMRAWFRQRARSVSNVPTPTDAPTAHAPGPDADRILLFGTPATIGSGVLSFDIGLPGQLAREVSLLTGRGVDVDVQTDVGLTIENAVVEAATLSLWRYDALVVVLGGADALLHTPVGVWRRELGLLLEVLRVESSASTRVMVAGIPPLRGVPAFGGLFGRAGDRHAVSLNAASRWECVASGSTFVPLPAQDAGRERYRTAVDYRAWAALLAPSVVADIAAADTAGTADTFARQGQPLDMAVMARVTVPDSARTRREGPQREDERQAALDALRILDTAPEVRLDHIVAAAGAAFGTRFAAFTLIDHDRQWVKSRVGFDDDEGHRVDDLCVLTIRQGSTMVVPDVGADSRFGARPGDSGDPGVGFFAGHAVESPSGHRIGVLCVFDPDPRDIGSLEPTQLAAFGHAIAEEVWHRDRSADAGQES